MKIGEVEFMNGLTPDLLTLVSWAEQLAAGERCAPWEAWCGSSSEAARQWARVIEAREFLTNGGGALTEEAEISAEDLAAFVEGRLTAEEARRVELACWRSIGQLAELLSAARFMNGQALSAAQGEYWLQASATQQLEARLLALLPAPKPQNGHGAPRLFRIANAVNETKAESGLQETPPPGEHWLEASATQIIGPEASATQTPGRGSLANAWLWSAAAAALVLVVVLSGTIGYLAATWRNKNKLTQPMAGSPEERRVTPEPVDGSPQPVTPREPEEVPKTELPGDSSVVPQPVVPEVKEPSGAVVVPVQAGEKEVPKVEPRREPAPGGPKYRPRVAPQTPQLVIRSAQGVLLVDAGQRGVWRIAPASFSLVEPLKVLSVAESWTTAEAAGVGTFIWEGNAEAEVAALADGTIEVRLVYGRMGIDDLRAGAQVRLLNGEAAWTVRGVGSNSTVAVVSDPVSPGLLVVRGDVEADGMTIVGGQVTRWVEGVPQAPQAINAVLTASNSQQALTPPVMNPWDVAWLTPPDENARKQWRQVYGKLVERLTAVENSGEELPKLLTGTREPRQAALVARWNLATASGAERPRKTWELLADRRAAVRVAGVKSVVELPPGDERLGEMGRFLIANVGPATAERISQWHDAAWQPGAPPKGQAEEIIAHLQHNDLAVRQFAVSYLELYTMAALMKLGMTPPAYDATATDARRAAAQMQWREIIQQLYNPNRKFPGVLTPRLQNALQKNALQNVP